MIKEDFVSVEIAKLLEEKGFNEPTWTRYEDNNEVIFGNKYNWNNSPMGQISAPTHQMTMRWLREVHKIEMVIHPSFGINCELIGYTVTIFRHKKNSTIHLKGRYDVYEKAVEAGLKYSLKNLI